MIVVDAQTVSLFPYSSNQCSILQTLSDKKMEQCVTAHFWCKDDMIISESKVTFEDSIKKCKGLIQSITKKIILFWFKRCITACALRPSFRHLH